MGTCVARDVDGLEKNKLDHKDATTQGYPIGHSYIQKHKICVEDMPQK